MKSKKADVWISAILYIALAVALITIVLTAGMPILDRIRDKNVVLQTKEVLFSLNDDILSVFRQGPGAQIPILVQINKGDFSINCDNQNITWRFKTKSILSQPDIQTKEGDINIMTAVTSIKDEYEISLFLNYKDQTSFELVCGKDALKSSLPISGNYNLIVKNLGAQNCLDCKIQIQIKEQ